jgi:hypothetical protein
MRVARKLRTLHEQFGKGRVIAQIKGGCGGSHLSILVMRAAYRKR